MADFVQKTTVKSTIRKLTTPITDVAAFNTIVQLVRETRHGLLQISPDIDISGDSRCMPLSSGSRRKQGNQVPVIKGSLQPFKKFHIPAIFKNVDKIPEGIRSRK